MNCHQHEPQTQVVWYGTESTPFDVPKALKLAATSALPGPIPVTLTVSICICKLCGALFVPNTTTSKDE